MPDNYRWKRNCDKYIAFMTTVPPAPEAPLQPIAINVVAASLHLGVSTNLTIYIVPICVAVEQKRTHVRLLPVSNILLTFE